MFPNSLVAATGQFAAREFFEIADAADREPVEVDFPSPAPTGDASV